MVALRGDALFGAAGDVAVRLAEGWGLRDGARELIGTPLPGGPTAGDRCTLAASLEASMRGTALVSLLLIAAVGCGSSNNQSAGGDVPDANGPALSDAGKGDAGPDSTTGESDNDAGGGLIGDGATLDGANLSGCSEGSENPLRCGDWRRRLQLRSTVEGLHQDRLARL